MLQAVIGALPATAALELVGELDGHVLRVALDTHGSWGLSVAFKCTSAPFILEQVARNLRTLATQQHGVRVVQRVVKSAAAAGVGLGSICDALVADGDVGSLATHQFGNYAVQVGLRHCAPPQQTLLLEALLPHTLALSSSKHGSNVAEQLLNLATDAQLAPVCSRVFSAGVGENIGRRISRAH